MNNNNRTARPLCFLIAAVVLVFALASTVNGQQPEPKGDVVVTIWDEPALGAGEGLYGFTPSWFVMLKVEDRHSHSFFGSGCFITDRLILTCAHNIRGAEKITVRNGPGDQYDSVKIALQSPKLDLAILLVEDEDVPYHRTLDISNGNYNPEGTINSIGFVPANDAVCRYEGTLTGRSYGVVGLTGAVTHSHTATVVQGMSGGPLIDSRGEVVGVNIAHSEATGSLAVKLTRIQWFLDQYQGRKDSE